MFLSYLILTEKQGQIALSEKKLAIFNLIECASLFHYSSSLQLLTCNLLFTVNDAISDYFNMDVQKKRPWLKGKYGIGLSVFPSAIRKIGAEPR